MIRAEKTELFSVSREALWETLSNTERLNRTLGLPAVDYTFQPRPEGGSLVRGEARFGPITLRYTEEPYRWIAPCLWWVQRLPENGPVTVYRVGVQLEATAEGTTVTAWSEAEPRGVAGRALARRIVESSVSGLLKVCAGATEKPAPQPRAPAESLHAFLRTAPPEEVVDFRPFVLADQWGQPRREVLLACLGAVRAGELELHWRLLCPACRGAGPSVETLSALASEKAHCESCNIRFGPAFDRDVEVCFSVAPHLRRAADGRATYCIGGPHRSQHVVMQWYLLPNTTEDIALELPPGRYRLRSPQSTETVELTLPLAEPLTLDNGFPFPRLFRLESLTWREVAATAAEVTTLGEFRRHFGSEVLAPGMELDVRQLVVLFTDLKGSTKLYAQQGDAPSYARVRAHFAQLTELIEAHQGAVVKTIGDAVMAVFSDPADALRAALAIQRVPGALTIKLGLHAGPALAVGANGQLDYFGHTVNVAARIQQESEGGDIVLTEALATCHAALLRGIPQQDFTATLRGTGETLTLRRLRPS